MAQYINGALALLSAASAAESVAKRASVGYKRFNPTRFLTAAKHRPRIPSNLKRKLRRKRPQKATNMASTRDMTINMDMSKTIHQNEADTAWYQKTQRPGHPMTAELQSQHDILIRQNATAANLYPYQKTIIYKRKRYTRKKKFTRKKIFRKRYSRPKRKYKR